MCVILSKKLPSQNGKKFNIFKIRDRGYDVTYRVKTITFKNNITVLYLIDEFNEWTEGINSKGIMVVSSALENHFDEFQEKPSKQYKEFMKKINKRNGIILRRALRQITLEDAMQVLIDTLFVGNTLISDGDKCYSLEIALPKEVFEIDNSFDDIEEMGFHEFKMQIMKSIKPDDFIVSVKEIKEDLYVKTNHSIDVRGLGYSTSDVGYKSSMNRRKTTLDKLKDFKGGSLELVMFLNTLGDDNIDKNQEYRPIRIKDKIDLPNKDKVKQNISNYYSTDIIGLVPNGTLIILPLHSKLKNVKIDTIQKKSGVSLLILNNESIIRKAYNKIKEK